MSTTTSEPHHETFDPQADEGGCDTPDMGADLGLPTGTVTLLLGDVEGSTGLWETQPDQMAVALEELNLLLDDISAVHHGARPLEQGEGDSFVLAFSRCSDAVGAALVLGSARPGGLLRLRLGLNTGEVQLRDAGNYMGPVINKAARIRDTGNGGQILLSQTSAGLAGEDLPPGASLVDRGEHQLRGIGRPERLWQLTHPDLAEAAARPLRTADVGRHNLSVQLTTFIGRGRELAALHGLLDQSRAVTLTGAGGCGKTRLALELAAERLDIHTGGVWFVDLSATNVADGVEAAVAGAIGLVLQASGQAQSIAKAIGEAPTLIVFDNCEHLIDACAQLTEELLRSCPNLSVLSTSREPLGITGEVTFRIPSLSLPTGAEADRLETLEHYEAIALFLERARRARPNFSLDRTNATVVVDVCRRLDGIPLALELAAARLRVMSPTQLRDALDDRFRLLTGGARTAMPRQQTLQASVEWSYALLLEPEKDLLNRLSVFAGGFDLRGAEVVCSGDGLEGHHVLELLTQLVDKSLVIPQEAVGNAEQRFALLETVRAYGATRLVEQGLAESVRSRHYHWCMELAKLSNDGEAAYQDRVGVNYDNIRRALQWAEGQDDPTVLGRLVSRLNQFWATSIHMAEGARWYEVAVAREADPRRLATALGRYALLLSMAGDIERAWAEGRRAVELTRSMGDDIALTWTLLNLGQSFPDGERLAVIEEALDLSRRIGDGLAQAWALFQKAWAIQGSDPVEAGVLFEESIRLGRTGGHGWVERMSAIGLGAAHLRTSPVRAAVSELEEAVSAVEQAGEATALSPAYTWLAVGYEVMGDSVSADRALAELEKFTQLTGAPDNRGRLELGRGLVLMFRGRWEEAMAITAPTLEYALEPSLIGYALSQIALCEVMTGHPDRAVVRAGTAMGSGYGIGAETTAVGGPAHALAMAARANGDLDRAEDLCRSALDETRHRPVLSWVRVSPLNLLGSLMCQTDRMEDGVRLLAAADAQARRSDVDPGNGLMQAEVDGQDGCARQALGDSRYEELWAEGAAMSWEEAVAFAQRGRGSRRRPRLGWDSLTPTESQVVELVAEGASNGEVAERLFMAVPTVKTHLTHIYGKLGLTSRSQLVAEAVRRGST